MTASIDNAKLEVLSMINSVKTSEEIYEIKDLLVKYFAQKAQSAIDALWDSGAINEQTIQDWGNEHMRTPYRYALRRSCFENNSLAKGFGFGYQ